MLSKRNVNKTMMNSTENEIEEFAIFTIHTCHQQILGCLFVHLNRTTFSYANLHRTMININDKNSNKPGREHGAKGAKCQ